MAEVREIIEAREACATASADARLEPTMHSRTSAEPAGTSPTVTPRPLSDCSRAIEAFAERHAPTSAHVSPGRVPGTREAVVHPNYILVYRVTAEAVEILRLMHARQRYP